MNPTEKVNIFLDLITEYDEADIDEILDLLLARGVAEEDAECLIAFVPMAFAHALFTPEGVTFPPSFLITDLDTDKTAQGLLAHEPIYTSARAIAEQLAHGDDMSMERLEDVAALSAEYGVILDLAEANGNFKIIVLTEPVLVRVPITHLTNPRQ